MLIPCMIPVNVMDNLCVIPEFSERVSQNLDYPSLARCLRVSKLWHDLFAPHLWHTFGGSTFAPVRFGINSPPQGSHGLPAGTFPICVPYPETGAATTAATSSHHPTKKDTKPRHIQALSIANPSHYANPYQAYTDTWWGRLFSKNNRPRIEELVAALSILRKYGHHTRCLVAQSLDAFRSSAPYCTRLQAFYCQFGFRMGRGALVCWDESLSAQEVEDAYQEIVEFVRSQPQLVSLHINFLNNSIKTGIDLLKCCKHPSTGQPRQWKHFDVLLGDQHFLDVVALLPAARSARFVIQSLATLSTPLPQPHRKLHELKLTVPHQMFTVRELRNVLASFPNLRRLVINTVVLGSTGLDLVLDHGTMLFVDGLHFAQGEVLPMVSLFSDLLVFSCREVTKDCFTPLARDHQGLVHVAIERIHQRTLRPEADFLVVPPATVSQLLHACPNLKTIAAPDDVLHVEHVLEAPMVVEKVDLLACDIVGVPRILPSESDLYKTLMAQWPAIMEHGTMEKRPDHEQAVLRKIEIRERFRQILQERFRRVSATWCEDFMRNMERREPDRTYAVYDDSESSSDGGWSD